MKRRALLVLPMVACLMIAVFATASSAKDDPGMSSGSPVVQSPVSQSSDPSGEVTGRGHHRLLEAMYEKTWHNRRTEDQNAHFTSDSRTEHARPVWS